jgi:hypothetical protein
LKFLESSNFRKDPPPTLAHTTLTTHPFLLRLVFCKLFAPFQRSYGKICFSNPLHQLNANQPSEGTPSTTSKPTLSSVPLMRPSRHSLSSAPPISPPPHSLSSLPLIGPSHQSLSSVRTLLSTLLNKFLRLKNLSSNTTRTRNAARETKCQSAVILIRHCTPHQSKLKSSRVFYIGTDPTLGASIGKLDHPR